MPHLALIAAPAAALLLALTASLPAGAEISAECRAMFEGDRLSVIVANGAGGGYDTYARAMAPVIAEATGARVSVENLPGAEGLIAARRIIEAHPDEWVILLEEADDILYSVADGAFGPGGGEKFQLMSIFHAEPSVWVVRPGFDPLDPPDGRLTSGSSAPNDDVGFEMLAKAVGMASQTIGGYAGTSAMSLGLLGGEVDVISISLATAQRTTEAGDLEIAFVLSDGPYPGAPELPYLLGAGGQLERRLASMTEAEQAEAKRLAGVVVNIGFVLRTVVVSTALPPDRMACLESVMNEVLLGDAFRSAAEAEGRPVNALTSEASQDALSRLMRARDAIKAINMVTP
jgi:tripartite-type tricarboxylate transporter receptor subunit TctC